VQMEMNRICCFMFPRNRPREETEKEVFFPLQLDDDFLFYWSSSHPLTIKTRCVRSGTSERASFDMMNFDEKKSFPGAR
jgi:hypothetical protein